MKYNEIKPEKPYRISASKLNLFKDCPAKYYFTYMTDIPRKQTKWPGTGFGTVIHEILEWVSGLKNEGIDDKEILKQIKGQFTERYNIWLKEAELNNEFKKSRGYDYEEFIKKGESRTQSFVKFFLTFFGQSLKFVPEEEFEIEGPVKDTILNGFIDLQIEYDNQLRIIDFKTTKDSNKFYFVDWDKDNQSLVYIWKHLRNTKEFPEAFGYLVMNHEEKTIFYKERILEDVSFKTLEYNIKELISFIESPDLSKTNADEFKCRWCDVKNLCQNPYQSEIQKKIRKKIK